MCRLSGFHRRSFSLVFLLVGFLLTPSTWRHFAASRNCAKVFFFWDVLKRFSLLVNCNVAFARRGWGCEEIDRGRREGFEPIWVIVFIAWISTFQFLQSHSTCILNHPLNRLENLISGVGWCMWWRTTPRLHWKGYPFVAMELLMSSISHSPLVSLSFSLPLPSTLILQ